MTRRFVVLIASALALVVGGGTAFAYWTASGTGSATGTADTLPTGGTPTVAVAYVAGGPTATITVPAKQTNTAHASISNYSVSRYANATGGPAASTLTCTMSACSETQLAGGTWYYADSPEVGTWLGAESPRAAVQVASKVVFTTPAVSGATSAAANLGPLTVQLQDPSGNAVVASTPVYVALSSSSATAHFAASPGGTDISTVTIAAGATSVNFYYGDGTSGSPTITASVPSLTSGTQTESIASVSAAKLLVTAGSSQKAGTSFAVQITAQDANGNTVTAYSGAKTITFSGPGSSASGKAPAYPATVTFTSGVGAATVTLYNAETTAIKASDGSISGTSGSITVTAGTASNLAWTHVTNAGGTLSSPCVFTCTQAAAGNFGTFTANVSVTDGYGNVVSNLGTGHTVTVSTAGGGAFTSPTAGTSLTLTISPAGAADSTQAFTFKAQNGNWTSDSITATTAAVPAYSSASATVTKN